MILASLIIVAPQQKSRSRPRSIGDSQKKPHWLSKRHKLKQCNGNCHPRSWGVEMAGESVICPLRFWGACPTSWYTIKFYIVCQSGVKFTPLDPTSVLMKFCKEEIRKSQKDLYRRMLITMSYIRVKKV